MSENNSEKKLHKTNNLKRKIMKLSILLMPFLIIVIIIVFGNSRLAMKSLPKGDYLSSVDSLNGEYTLNAYLYDGCGATCAFTLRVELVNNITGEAKNIYWQYKESKATMKWIDDEIVEINGKKLNIEKGEFCNGCKD